MSGSDVRRSVIGYSAACLAVALALWLPLALWSILRVVLGLSYTGYGVGSGAAFLLVGFAITLIVTFPVAALPALALIAVTERRTIRAWWVHALGGAAIGGAAYVMISWLAFDVLPNPAAMAIFTALGGIGGSVYWFIVVRGRTKPEAIVK